MTVRIGIALVLLLAGAILLAAGAGSAWTTRSWSEAARHAQGEVVDFESDRSGRKKRHRTRALVEFRAEDGRAIRVLARMSGTPQPYEIGERLAMLYNAARPEEARIDSFGELWALPAILAGIGATLMTVAALILRLGRSRV